MPRNKRGRSGQRVKRTKEEWEEMKRKNPELEQSRGYQLPPKTNEAFEKFYEGIGIVPEEEWETFLETMKKPLPTTFRITGSRSQAQELLKIIKGQYFSKFFSKKDGSPKMEPKSLPWYPDELAWQLDYTKKEIKNDNALKSLHGFLISETESGNISRQEAVSMLPPLLMEIEPHHKILDMCAAPGSKTAQLIEMLHSDENVPVPEGYVVANDMDNKRCYLMTHQVKRIQSPNCMIINHDARILPNMFTSKDTNAERVKYDRILCDVPCSGDGTMRKNPDIWKKWHVNGAYNLHSGNPLLRPSMVLSNSGLNSELVLIVGLSDFTHPRLKRIQKKVLQRGLELLAVGGRLVYSTCSLNPVEDEAVILALIKQCAGSIELVDVSNKLTGLNYCKGTYSWKVMSKKLVWYEKVEQAPKEFQDAWDSTMYPPVITEAQDAKLERCIRVLPHQQNTGAFFIAVIEKMKELPWVTQRTLGRFDTVLASRHRLDESEKKISGSEHFTFGFRSSSGLYIYARCNLCNILLQGRNDYNSHSRGKKHRLELEKHESEKKDGSTKTDQVEQKTETESDKPENSDASMETENAACVKTGNATCVEMENASCVRTDNADITLKMEVGDEKSESCNGEKTENADKLKADSKVSENSIGADDIKTETQDENEERSEQVETSGDTADDRPPPAKRLKKEEEDEIRVVFSGHREDPFLFCSLHDPIWPSIKNFYEISDDLGVEQIMYRNMKRVLYYVSKPIRNLVICNSDRVKFINLGVKCFSNAPSPLVPDCDFRLSQEGLLAIQKHVKGRRVMLTKQDIIAVLSQENPFICKLGPKAQESVYSMDPGSVVFHFKPSESDPEPNVEIVFCGWRGKTSVRSFVGKDERSHYLRLCGVELTDIQSQVQEKKAAREMSLSGTETPVGIPSGDEAELEQWNKEEEAPRGSEADDVDEDKNVESMNDEDEAGLQIDEDVKETSEVENE